MTLPEDLEQQLAEVEMIEAMFPDEFTLGDPLSVAECRSWLDGGSPDPPPRLSFTIRLDPVEVQVSLPRDYPSIRPPQAFVSSSSVLDRRRHSELNRSLADHVGENFVPGDVAVVVSLVVSWLQHNADGFVDPAASCRPETGGDQEKDEVAAATATRYWIRSHHIYSKTKRRNILRVSADLGLTGFCLPGRPGVVCLEGSKKGVNEAWAQIRSWNWQKIGVRLEEEEEGGCEGRRFGSFEEVGFVKAGGGGQDRHTDMRGFLRFLEEHESGHVFKELFGMDN